MLRVGSGCRGAWCSTRPWWVLQIFAVLLFSALSDRVGRRPVMLAGVAFLALYAFPLFRLVNTGSPATIFLALAIAFFGAAAIFGPTAAFISESFGTRVRYSGASLGYQMGAVLGDGLSPFIAIALLGCSGGASWTAYLILEPGSASSPSTCSPRRTAPNCPGRRKVGRGGHVRGTR